MALKIRMQRHGAKGQPLFRLVVCESTTRRDGRFVEILGTYNPNPGGRDSARPVVFNLDRVEHWLKIGAKPSDTAWSLIKRARRGEFGSAEVPATPTAPAEAAPAQA